MDTVTQIIRLAMIHNDCADNGTTAVEIALHDSLLNDSCAAIIRTWMTPIIMKTNFQDLLTEYSALFLNIISILIIVKMS